MALLVVLIHYFSFNEGQTGQLTNSFSAGLSFPFDQPYRIVCVS